MTNKMNVRQATKLLMLDTAWILGTVAVVVFLTGIAYVILSSHGYPVDTIRWMILLIATLVAAPSVYLLKRGKDLANGLRENLDNSSEESMSITLMGGFAGRKTSTSVLNSEDFLVQSVPLLGTIAAEKPLPTPDKDPSRNGTLMVRLTRDICKDTQGVYALRVTGESMVDALINDGDIVIMRHQETARNGETVAVWLKDRQETTLKRIYVEGNRVQLQPVNPTVKPIYVDPEYVEIQGKVIAVIRSSDLVHSDSFESDSRKTKA